MKGKIYLFWRIRKLVIDKNMLEFWGQAFLNAGRSIQQWEKMSKVIGQNTGNDYTSIGSLFSQFNWPKSSIEKNTESMIEMCEKLSGTYNEIIKAYLTMFNVVSEKKYLSVLKENEKLKTKIYELEEILKGNANKPGEINYYPKKIVDNLTQVMSDQSRQFQELLKQLNQPLKKAATARKNNRNSDDNN